MDYDHSDNKIRNKFAQSKANPYFCTAKKTTDRISLDYLK